MSDIVEIASFGTTFEARTASAHLASEGIKSSVLTDNAGGTIPSMSQLEGGVRLVTRSEDAQRARDILNTLEEEEAEPVALG
jgi:hypothetical protein